MSLANALLNFTAPQMPFLHLTDARQKCAPKCLAYLPLYNFSKSLPIAVYLNCLVCSLELCDTYFFYSLSCFSSFFIEIIAVMTNSLLCCCKTSIAVIFFHISVSLCAFFLHEFLGSIF